MKTTQTFSVQFIARTKKLNPEQALIYARITVCRKAVEISLKRNILYAEWNRKAECVSNKTLTAKQINKHIDNCRYRLMECYQQLLIEHKVISAEKIKSLFLGETESENTLLGLILFHNKNMQGVLTHGTLKNYYTTEKYLKIFLQEKYKSGDIYLSSLSFQFITEFEFYLRTCKPLDKSNPPTNNGIMKHLERLRKMVTLACKMEWITKDPFARYKLKFKKREMLFLSTQELFKIEHTDLNKEILNRVRDIFIFSCYTGLSYIDLVNLNSTNICIGIDGEYWIKTNRQKTETQVNVPLLPKAYEVIQKYRSDTNPTYKQKLLPLISNQKVNSHLKEITAICGIEKDLTFHAARHTFATTVTLTNGVPVETVSKMLGHSKLSTTQIYVHVLQHKISQDMKLLREKLIVEKEKMVDGVNLNFSHLYNNSL